MVVSIVSGPRGQKSKTPTRNGVNLCFSQINCIHVIFIMHVPAASAMHGQAQSARPYRHPTHSESIRISGSTYSFTPAMPRRVITPHPVANHQLTATKILGCSSPGNCSKQATGCVITETSKNAVGMHTPTLQHAGVLALGGVIHFF